MRVHRNAKTTLKMRELIVTRAQHGWTCARIATALGISVRTVAKWVARARQAQLADGSSRPPRHPRRLAPRLQRAVIALRWRRATAWQSVALGLPRSTVTRVLARAGLIVWRSWSRRRWCSATSGHRSAVSCMST